MKSEDLYNLKVSLESPKSADSKYVIGRFIASLPVEYSCHFSFPILKRPNRQTIILKKSKKEAIKRENSRKEESLSKN